MNEFLTVGIDIGTTTTHLSFSRLRLGNVSRPNEPVRMTVVERIPVYASQVYRTPLTADDRIDSEAVVSLVRAEYDKAKIAPEEVATGAVIITGETAKKRNAESIVNELSKLAGNLVAASAGPHLESILAARGSGACDASLDGKKICNIDIGGGTTNIGICERGKVVHTDWLEIGGRVCSEREVESAARAICEAVDGQADEYWFSGGVGSIIFEPQAKFNDAGPALARALVNELQLRRMAFAVPQNAIRATVIGAGTHSFQLSGSTVCIQNCELPLRNLPIFKVDDLKSFRPLFEADEPKRCAISLQQWDKVSYVELKKFAHSLAQTCELKLQEPYVILIQRDIAAALGQLIAAELPGKSLIVLDGVGTEYGDYIDIGQPMSNGQFVPVVVKELVFDVD